MLKAAVSNLRNVMTNTAGIWYHIVILILSAGIALSLPMVARSFLAYWARVENEKIYLVSLEINFLMLHTFTQPNLA